MLAVSAVPGAVEFAGAVVAAMLIPSENSIPSFQSLSMMPTSVALAPFGTANDTLGVVVPMVTLAARASNICTHSDTVLGFDTSMADNLPPLVLMFTTVLVRPD